MFFRNIEIWENQGTINNPNYQKLDEKKDFTTDNTRVGEVMRIDRSQCTIIPPSP